MTTTHYRLMARESESDPWDQYEDHIGTLEEAEYTLKRILAKGTTLQWKIERVTQTTEDITPQHPK